MRTRRTEIALWTVATALMLLAALGWRTPPDDERTGPLPIPPAGAAPVLPDAASLDEAATYAVEHDPFRLERRPSEVPYVPGVEGGPPPPPDAPKPTLVLTGIMGGPPWHGVVEGLPGTSGSAVVHVGQTIADLRVTRMTNESITIEGMDTTWTLNVRRGW